MSSSDTLQESLDATAVQVQEAARLSSFAAGGIAQAAQTGDTSQLRSVYEDAKRASDAAYNALRRLLAIGAKRPDSAAPVARDTLRLDQLDTPTARAFLAALEQAAEAGAQLDRERGWVDEDGEPIGHGETLAGMALQMRTEIFGPDSGGRE